MPRGRVKVSANENIKTNIKRDAKSPEENDLTKNKEDIKVKLEPTDEEEPSTSGTPPDLSRFKFQKKPHVKIEFEKDSPTKQVKDTFSCHINVQNFVP